MVSALKSAIYICLALLISTQLIFSQGSISGHITDADTGEGLSYVNVIIHNTTKGTVSDHNGNFRVDGLTEGKYGITFSMIGFKTVHLESIGTGSDPLFIEMHPEAYLKDEVVVSASRKSQSLSLAPASAAVISKEQLIETRPKSFDDAFHGVNGVQVTRSSGSNVQALSIRGASEVAGGGIGNRVLLLLDGRPAITPESGGALWNLVPLGAIERIEVIKGAYSSLFGSSAMGGVVNVITRVPDTISRTEFHVQYGFYGNAPAYADYHQFGDFYQLDFTQSAKKNKLSYVLNGAFKENDGHRDKTYFRTYNAFGKIKYDFSANRSLQFSAMYNDIFNDTPATWRSSTKAYSVADHRKDDSQKKREWNADLHYQAFARANIRYSSRFYFYSNKTDFVFNADPLNDSTNVNIGKQFVDDESVFVSRIGNASQMDISLNEKHYFIAGVDVQSDFIDGKPDTVLYGVHEAWNVGAFIQDQFIVSPQWIITAGIRYDQYKIVHTFSEGNVSPKIAAVFQPNEKIAVRGLIARAFRNPSISERFTKFEQGGGLTFIPNPQLRSEKLTFSAEVGAKISLTQNLKVDAAVFYNHYKDLISYQQRFVPGKPFVFEVINLNKALMQGVEISFDYLPYRWLKIQTGYTYLDARDDSDNRVNDVLPYKSKHTGYLNFYGTFGDLNIYLQTRGRSRIHEVFIYPGSEPDGYILMNCKLSYQINKSASAYIAINNIANVQYEEIERYRLEGRNFAVGINLQL